MSPLQRVLLFVATVAVLVVAFVAFRPGDDDTAPTTQTAAAAPPASTAPPIVDPAAEPAPPVPPPAPRPAYVQIRAKGLQPVGGVKKIKVGKGDTVRFEIRSDRADEGHLHGYDISKPVGPGKRARYRFTAKIEGIFELELEHAGVPIAELVVEP